MKALDNKNSLVFEAILIILFVSNLVFPQVSDISFEQIFLEEGLSQSIVKTILQDNQGFMYFGTEDGLNIYNGYSFRILRNDRKNLNSLSYNDITALCEDDSGNMWIGTFNSGVTLFIPSEKKFIRLYFDHKDENSLSNNNINAIAKDRLGSIWVGTDKGINKIKKLYDNGKILIDRGIAAGNKKILTDERILSLLIDIDNILWVGSENGLYRIYFDQKQNFYQLKYFNKGSDDYSPVGGNIRAIFRDSFGDLWVGTDNGLNRINSNDIFSSSPKFYKYVHSPLDPTSLADNIITAICQDSLDQIWIGTNGAGLSIYNRGKDIFYNYQNDLLDKKSLSSNEIEALYTDRSGIVWIGLYGSGINKVSRKGGQFYHYKSIPNNRNSLSHPIVWSFYEAKDSILWIGTHNGLNKYDRRTNSFTIFLSDSTINSLSNNIVRVITPTKDDKLLLGTNGGGIDEFDPKTENFRNFSNDPNNPNSLSYNFIREIYEDREGYIWIGTYGKGMDRYDPSSGEFINYRNDPEDPTSISHNYIREIVEDENENLWIGTEGGGLNKFEKKRKKFTSFRSNVNNPTALSSDYIFSILMDDSVHLWLGTYGGGLNKFNKNTGESITYTIDEGLASNSIYGILKDKTGNLWLSTTKGLARFDPAREKFKGYNVKDGLQDNEFNGGAYYKSEHGELFFGGIKGFNSFYPENIEDNNYIPPVVLTSFKKFNKEFIFSEPLKSIEEIVLPYTENVFSFEFAALDYFAPEKNQYAYKLEGVDKDWVYVNADKRFASYTTLSPGKYIFRVKASNSDGLWNEKGAKMVINIIPPFWQRSWFVIIVSFLFLGSAYFLYMRRLRITRMETELQTAHDAQLSIMPGTDPKLEKIEVSGACYPASEVGGDFFDYFRLNNDESKFGIIIGDVSGKAMKAAITAIMTSGMIISEANSNQRINRILEKVNNALLNKIDKKTFVSACICVIDCEKNMLSVSNAGLNRPLVLSENGILALKSEGQRLPLGFKENIEYEVINYYIKKGDIIVLTTDGIDEAQNLKRELYGTHRLKEIIEGFKKNNISASDIKNSILEDVRNFIEREKPSDDMTVIVIKIKDL